MKIAEIYNSSVDEIISVKHASIKKIEEQVGEFWGTPIDQLSAFADFGYVQFLKKIQGLRKGRTVDFAIVSTFAKGCLVLEEIIALLRAGLPDGAMSCARSLYEHYVYLAFLVRHRQNKELIERYFDYSDYEYYKELAGFKAHCNLVKQPFTKEVELRKMEGVTKKLIEKHGKQIKYEKFWYSCIPGCNNFADVAKHVGADIAKVFYKRSCQSIHSSPRNNFNPIGFELENDLLTGASVYMLDTPIRFAAFALTALYTCMLDYTQIEHADEYFVLFKDLYSNIIREMDLALVNISRAKAEL